jgi:hypothetical protein
LLYYGDHRLRGGKFPIHEHAMQNDTTGRTDINRLADDGCPNTTGDTQVHDLSKLLAALARDRGEPT